MATPSPAIPLDFVSKHFPGGLPFTANRAARAEGLSSAQAQLAAGRAAWRRGQTAQAGVHFRQAIALAPDHHPALCTLSDWCLHAGDLTGALNHSARAIALAPQAPHSRLSRAAALAQSGKHTEALHVLQPLLTAEPSLPAAASLFAKLSRRLGLEKNALELISRLLDTAALTPQDRAELHFSASELLDRLRRYDDAFAHAVKAHDAHRKPYDPNLIRQQTAMRLAYFTPHKLHGLPRATHGSRRPIFIIGMPRSGTSLVEQILASHPDVYGAGEIANLGDIVSDYTLSLPLESRNYPVCLDALSLRTCNELAARYLSGLSRLNSTARYVTDKMLPNFLYLGAISALFPDAHVIHCTRDPLDTCLSCYMTDFVFGHEFAQDLSHLADYHRHYNRLMSHWRDTLKFPLIEVSYERVVANLEGEVRRLLEHLGLAWDERCLNFHCNPRLVPTASVEQVRQPLYSRSVGRWRHYERHLQPLIEGLNA